MDDTRPRIRIAYTPENPWKLAYNVFHTESDLPAASIVHPFFFTYPNGTQKKHQRISLSKMIITRQFGNTGYEVSSPVVPKDQ